MGELVREEEKRTVEARKVLTDGYAKTSHRLLVVQYCYICNLSCEKRESGIRKRNVTD